MDIKEFYQIWRKHMRNEHNNNFYVIQLFLPLMLFLLLISTTTHTSWRMSMKPVRNGIQEGCRAEHKLWGIWDSWILHSFLMQFRWIDDKKRGADVMLPALTLWLHNKILSDLTFLMTIFIANGFQKFEFSCQNFQKNKVNRKREFFATLI